MRYQTARTGAFTGMYSIIKFPGKAHHHNRNTCYKHRSINKPEMKSLPGDRQDQREH
jgi:hypothetical protein